MTDWNDMANDTVQRLMKYIRDRDLVGLRIWNVNMLTLVSVEVNRLTDLPGTAAEVHLLQMVAQHCRRADVEAEAAEARAAGWTVGTSLKTEEQRKEAFRWACSVWACLSALHSYRNALSGFSSLVH